MLSKDTKVLGFNQYRKSDKTPSTIHEDLECKNNLDVKRDGCKNNFKESSTAIVGEHIPCGCSMSAIWTFHGIENKYNAYRGEVA